MTEPTFDLLEAIDPDDVIFGADGSIESMTDPDTGEVVKADPVPEVRAPRGPGDINPDGSVRGVAGTDEDGQDGDGDNNAPAARSGKSNSAFEQEFLADTLAVYGLDSDEIEWNGEQVRVGELTLDERREFLQELRDRDRAEAAGLDPAELELLDFLRAGGNLADVVGPQPVAGESQVAALDADGVNRLDIRQQFPSLSEEEVEAELEDRKVGKLYDKKTTALRERLTQTEVTERQRAETQEFEAERQQFIAASAAIKEIAGFAVSPEVSQWLLAQTATRQENGQSPFLNSLTPEKIQRLQFLDAFEPQMRAHYEAEIKAAEKRGREQALQGAPSRPSGRSGSASVRSQGTGTRHDPVEYADYILGESPR